MSAYEYDLTITDESEESLTFAIGYLTTHGVIPDKLDIRTPPYPCQYGWFLELSTGEDPWSVTSPRDSIERILYDLSVLMPNATLTLQGEEMNKPSSRFVKEYQNGNFRLCPQKEQGPEKPVKTLPLEPCGDPAPHDSKGKAMELFSQITAMRDDPAYGIASTMAYLDEYVDLDEPLTKDQLYQVSSKLQDSMTFFAYPLLQEELLDGLRFLLENGIRENNSYDFPPLSPKDTFSLLLSVDDTDFAGIVEWSAIQINEDIYESLPHSSDYLRMEDNIAVKDAISNATRPKPALEERISAAQTKAAAQPQSMPEKTNEPEK